MHLAVAFPPIDSAIFLEDFWGRRRNSVILLPGNRFLKFNKANGVQDHLRSNFREFVVQIARSVIRGDGYPRLQ